MYVGSHVSIRGGYYQAAQTAHKIGATAFQYFPKNPRSIAVKQFNQKDAENCAVFCHNHKMISVAHTPYPTKLIPENSDIEQQVLHSIINDLEIAEACGSIGIVVHFGITKKRDILDGYRKMIDMLNQVLSNWDGHTKLLIENNAGTSSDMGITLEEMVQIRNLTDYPEKIGFCLDTCHAYASGLWDGENWHEIEIKGNELGFFPNLKAIHLNNSKYPYGSRKDRHANIQTGHIAKKQIQTLLTSDLVKDLPFILETPKDESITHQAEIELVKHWAK